MSDLRRWAITGTDTGIGKTTVTRGIVRALTIRTLRVRPLKWVETGCQPDETGALVGEDATALARAANRFDERELIGPIRFRLPAGPVAAAQAEGRRLSADELKRTVELSSNGVDLVLIEGAGGALVPMTDDLLFVDACRQLARAEDFVLVTRDGLGTIHQTLATYEALCNRGCRVHAVVVNQRSQAEANDRTNSIEQLRHWIGAPLVLGPIPPLPGATDDQLASAVETIGLVERMWAALGRRT
jgi:dethiobiotin synthetase